MANEPTGQTTSSRQAAPLIGAGRPDLILPALNHLRGIQPAGGETFGTPTVARQKENLSEWARGLGLQLNADSIIPYLVRGGQEHDILADINIRSAVRCDLFVESKTKRFSSSVRSGIF